MRVVHDVLIPMRDGVRLAANLYLPAGPGPFPAILEYTPYLKDGPGGRGPVETAHLLFARHGYACLTLDMRGFGASEGTASPPFSASEKQDGYEVLDWMAAQPWCNGRTGIWGISYGGDTALSVASTQPPSLRAIIPIHATDDEFSGVCYPHGCRGGLWSEIDWGLRVFGYQLLPPLRFHDGEGGMGVWAERLDRLEPWPLTWHTLPPSIWAGWRVDVAAIRAATYLVSAWHDCYPRETLRAYNTLAAPKRVLIGPWKHEHPDRAVNEPIGFLHEMTRWWDHWLKDIDTGIMDEPPVIIYHQRDRWRSERAWPPADTGPRDYYLQPDGRLLPAAVAGDGHDAYRVDPTVGLARLPWDWTTPTSFMPPDISPDDHRALTYTTPPLEADLDIIGEPEVIVHLSTDHPDFPLAAWLGDVAPRGFSTLICQGWIRPIHVAGEPLQPGRVYCLRVPCFPTSYRLSAGHRLRLAIAGAHFPVLVSAPRNPTLTVYRSARFPSRLRLPVAASPHHTQAGPVFQPALAPRPEALLVTEADHTVSRDLLDRRATHRQHRRAVYRLDGGTSYRMDLETSATIAASSPGDISLRGTQTIAVERFAKAIMVRTEVLEGYEHLHLSADITVDGRPFYHRDWDLDLRNAAWNLHLPRSS